MINSDIYDKISEKFSQTRQKTRPEIDLMLDYILDFSKNKKKVKILDLWCGDWRLLGLILKKWINVEYVWVDLSKNLIEIAKKQNPKYEFVHCDMIDFIKNTKQDSIDIVITLASYQHILNWSDRIIFAKLVYRSLCYWWKWISINWSMSDWFRSKYQKYILFAKFKSIISLWFWDCKNIKIPFVIWKNRYLRDYHIFDILEIKKIWLYSWFYIDILKFCDKNWKLSENISDSRNSFVIFTKNDYSNK